jgi:rubredoxin
MEIIIGDFNVKELVLEVRVSNTPAIALYHKNHFERVHIIEQYYQDQEDAFFMAYNHDPHNRYRRGSSEMTEADILKHYMGKKLPQVMWRCPNCRYLMLKELPWVKKPAAAEHCNKSVRCPKCPTTIPVAGIAQGTYDAVVN